MDEERLHAIVGSLYEAASTAHGHGALADAVFRAMDVESGIMFVAEHPSGRLQRLVGATANFSPGAQADYVAYYHQRNEWFQRAVGRRPPYVALGQELIDDASFERTEFCADWCRRIGIRHMIGGLVPVAPGVVVGAGVHRPADRPAFGPDEKRLYGIVLAHFARGIQIADRLAVAGRTADLQDGLIESLDLGVMVLDRDARLLRTNAVASRLLSASRWFIAARGVVRPVTPSAQPAFSRLVSQAAATAGGTGLSAGGLLSLRDPIEPDLPVLVAPCRSRVQTFGGTPHAALVLFADPDAQPRTTPESVATVLGLSPAEGRLVHVLAQGRTLVDAAPLCGISLNTAKTQLRSVFDKTGWTRQTELVAAVRAHPLLRLAGPAAPMA